MRWIAEEPPRTTRALSVRLRYRHAGVSTTLDLSADGDVELRFATPQFAVTPGQMAVLYDGDEVLGGGWIAKPEKVPASDSPVP